MKKNIVIAFGLLLCMQLYASKSPDSILTNLSDDDFPSLNKKDRIEVDEDTFYDAKEGLHESEKQKISQLQPKDIEALDQYSGLDKYFDDLYKFAKRDLYLAQQNEKLFPDKVHSYENLKKYYEKLKDQREQMAVMKQSMNKLVHNNYRMLDARYFEPTIQSQIIDLDLQVQNIFSKNVQQPTNPKMLVDYKIPYGPQLQINELKLQQARIMLNALQNRAGK